MASSAAARPGEWRAGGVMLAAAAICYACSSMPIAVVGALIKPLGDEYGWSRAAISSAFLFTALGTMLVGPFTGNLVDRIGPRRVALVGLVLLAFGVGLIGLSGPALWSWYAVWAIYAFVQACSGNVIWANAVVSRFDRNRGLALALLLSPQALSYGMLPSFAVWMVARGEWRVTFFTFAAFTLLVAWPIAWRFFFGARDLARIAAQRGNAPPPAAAPPVPLRAILADRHFWQIALAFGIGAATVSTLFVHFQPVLIDRGFSPMLAASVVILLGPASIGGRFISGLLLDRLPPNRVAAALMILPAISYMILLGGVNSLWQAYACVLLLGIAAGAESDLLAYLVSRYFGSQSFGTLYGLLLGVFAMGYGASPVLTGRAFDATGSYELAFTVLAGAALVASGMILGLGKARER